jgi:excisionase family DNA binding protein
VPTYLTIEQVAELFKINRSTVYLWIDRGMPSVKIGKTRRFIKEEIEEWISKQRE